jgi:hypothetical protein
MNLVFASSFLIPQQLAFLRSAVWQGNALAGSASGAVNALGGGWRVSGIIDNTTGPPSSVTVPDNSGTGYGTMPDRICDPKSVPG